MIIKRSACLVLAASVLVALLGMEALAGGAWYVCEVDSAGPIALAHNNGARLFLTDAASSPAFQNQEFQVPLSRAKEFLAVALDAIDQRKKVKVYVSDSAAGAPPHGFGDLSGGPVSFAFPQGREGEHRRGALEAYDNF